MLIPRNLHSKLNSNEPRLTDNRCTFTYFYLDSAPFGYSFAAKNLFCLSTKEVFCIQSAGLVWNLTAGEHGIRRFATVWHHASACISLRLDEIQHFVLMIYRRQAADDIQGFALICLRTCDIIYAKEVTVCRFRY